MFFKTFKLHHKVNAILVLENGRGEDEEGDGDGIALKAMHNEYFMEEWFSFTNRDDAYSFIRNCPTKFVQDVVDRLVAEVCGGY